MGIEGWSDPNLRLLDYGEIEEEKRRRESNQCGCCAFSTRARDPEDEDMRAAADVHNDQVIKLIDALGQSGAGKRAVIKAIAGKQGVVLQE